MAYLPSEITAVRLLIPDTDAVFGVDGNEHLFDDAAIEGYLTLGKGNPFRAAGLASIAVGGSEALILKVTRNYETETDGAKLMKEWVAKGQALIAMAQAEDDAAQVGIFEIAYPEWDESRHPEGQTHGSYQGLAPTGWQW